MPEIGTFGLMSGDGKRSVGHRPQATAPILDSTIATNFSSGPDVSFRSEAEVGGAAEFAASSKMTPLDIKQGRRTANCREFSAVVTG